MAEVDVFPDPVAPDNQIINVVPSVVFRLTASKMENCAWNRIQKLPNHWAKIFILQVEVVGAINSQVNNKASAVSLQSGDAHPFKGNILLPK